MKKIVFLTVILCSNLILGQETVGLVFDDINKTKSNGYTLFNPLSDDRVFLINNCGEVVNQWDFSGLKSVSSYILQNGNLLQSDRQNADIRDWDNNIIWSLDFNTLGFRIHHDIEPLPNGNFLVFVKDRFTKDEIIAMGKEPSFSEEEFVLDRILEIQPVKPNSANIVWEWKFIDHIIQDFDNTKPNFGVVADNPQLLDINYDAHSPGDYVHCNGIDYNEELDQIIISARHTDELYIIDHSTTTGEAASHAGGIYGKGGDFLWRWGNPEVYDNGTEADKKIGRQHDAKWIEDGPSKNKISVFSNDGYGNDLMASSIHIIELDGTNGVYSLSDGKFLPNDYYWSWDGLVLDEVMQGSSRCGVQIMSNGNALTNETAKGRLTEIDTSGEVIWVYEIPVSEGVNFNQFAAATDNGTFKATRYPENYIGFDNVDFINSGIVEDINSISENCSNELSVAAPLANNIRVYPNPTKDILNFKIDKPIKTVEVYNLAGKILIEKNSVTNINLQNLENGIYLLKVQMEKQSELIKIIKN